MTVSDPKQSAEDSSPQNEKREIVASGDSSQNSAYGRDRRPSILGARSPGVARVEALNNQLTTRDRWFIFVGVFIIAYAYGLDGSVRFTFQTYATASYNEHSLQATINVLRNVIAAAAQPTAAKIADVFGRLELVAVSVVFYVVGTIVEATAQGVASFSAGAVLYQVGYTCILLLVEVIVADITSMKTRVIFSYISAMPFIINAWISGNVTSSVLTHTTWRWGIGMWAIIYTVCSLPLMTALWWAGHKARRTGELDKYSTPFKMLGPQRLLLELFWQLDVIGILLIIAILALVLVPLTIAGGSNEQWRTAHVIAPLVVGLCCIPAFIVWESRARHPALPFYLIRDRGVWAALGIACMLNFAWTLQGDYLYTVLVVAFDFSILAATRISSLYSFCSVVTGVLTGLVIIKVRRLKYFVVAGACLFLVAFGILIRFRSGVSSANQAGVIGGQVLLGIAGGLFPYTAQASIQAATQHEHVAIVTGLYLSLYSVGAALGNCVSGAVWTQTLPSQLAINLDPLGNTTLAASVYGDPVNVAILYAVGTPQRDAIINAYQHVQRYLTITGACLCVPLIVFAFCLRNPKLSDQQSQPEAEEGYIGR